MRYLTTILAALAIGCTDLNETIDYGDAGAPDSGTYEIEDEIGTATQPIIINGEYGATKAYTRCTHPFPGGFCYGANNKTFTVVFHSYSCDRTVAPHNGAWWHQAIWSGVLRSVDYLNVRGWAVTAIKQTSPGPSVAHVNVQCSYGTSGALGTTMIHEGIDNIFDCHDTPHGDFCQYSRGVIVMRPEKVLVNSTWTTATSTQRGNMVNNVVFHEHMHFAGLAHRENNPDAANIMMPAVFPWISPWWTTKMVPDVNQSLALYCYVPTSSTTPIVGCPAQ